MKYFICSEIIIKKYKMSIDYNVIVKDFITS